MDTAPPARPYRHAPIAADLRARIAAGEYPPGCLLPSTHEIQQRYGVGGRTARAALHQLIDDGLAEAKPARGTFVTARPDEDSAPPPRRTHASRRLSPSDAPTAGDADLTPQLRDTPTEEAPPADVALKLDTDRTRVTRHVLIDSAGRPVGLRTVYDTDRTGEADTVMTHTYARTATHIEARALADDGTVLLLCQDETHAEAQPIRLIRTMYRADQVRVSDQYRPQT